jgi:hypothetical protein
VCPVTLAEQREAVRGSPLCAVVYGGCLFLCSSRASAQRFRKDPARFVGRGRAAPAMPQGRPRVLLLEVPRLGAAETEKTLAAAAAGLASELKVAVVRPLTLTQMGAVLAEEAAAGGEAPKKKGKAPPPATQLEKKLEQRLVTELKAAVAGADAAPRPAGAGLSRTLEPWSNAVAPVPPREVPGLGAASAAADKRGKEKSKAAAEKRAAAAAAEAPFAKEVDDGELLLCGVMEEPERRAHAKAVFDSMEADGHQRVSLNEYKVHLKSTSEVWAVTRAGVVLKPKQKHVFKRLTKELKEMHTAGGPALVGGQTGWSAFTRALTVIGARDRKASSKAAEEKAKYDERTKVRGWREVGERLVRGWREVGERLARGW